MAAANQELKLHFYYYEVSAGAEKTTVPVISPNSEYPNFGEVRVMDVPLYDDSSKSKILGRAQGISVQADLKQNALLVSFDIVFEAPELKGSTLQVMGRWLSLTSTTTEWAIVGGTGKYALAKGVVYGRRLSTDESTFVVELDIRGIYTPIPKPTGN